jgi:hypothetical protein
MIDSGGGQVIKQGAGKGILTHPANHSHRTAQPSSGHGLIRSLAPWQRVQFAAKNGLSGLGNVVCPGYQVHI